MSRNFAVVFSIFLLVALTSYSQAAGYDIDPGHSSINFRIRHLVSKTRGSFKKFKGSFSYEPGKSESWKAEAEIDAASIETNEKKRDEHLRGADFFDVKKFPKITFKSTKVTDAHVDKAKLHGDLTMHGITKPVVMDVEIGGEGTDPWGNKKAGFTATTVVNRKDFEINFNKTVDKIGLLLGDEVEITLEIEGNVKKSGSKK